jgi:beta-alanine--pyruvate transaminase
MNDLATPAARPAYQSFWMPFTSNVAFKKNPRLFESAKGMYYRTVDGQEVLDGTAGLWCVNAGHGRERIADAVSAQMRKLDYASSFQLGHPLAFECADRITALAPRDLDYVFFGNSGSEAVDSALKIALAYHRANGNASRVRLVGRERSYHGVGFGGVSVGGISKHRAPYGNLLPYVDHMPATHDLSRQAYSRGEPEHGAHFADELLRIINIHDASTIAAVIVEPVAGSTGVLPPPKGYLARLREICDRHGILLIFDEVITGFGRLGATFAAEKWGVLPDILTCAKGLTNGAIPMGATLVRGHVYDTVTRAGTGGPELPHGYTYSGHPVACAAALATLDIYRDEKLFERAADLAPYWENALHALKGLPHIVDIRNSGLLAAIEFEPVPGKAGFHAQALHRACLAKGVLVRGVGESLVASPPLIIERAEIDRLWSTVADCLRAM